MSASAAGGWAAGRLGGLAAWRLTGWAQGSEMGARCGDGWVRGRARRRDASLLRDEYPGGSMTSGSEGRSDGLHANRGSARRELLLTLLLGAAGAGLVFLASRQGWAQVTTIPPKPLPASRVTVAGSALVPYADALALAGLATLAAVVASRRLARRLTGLLLALIGASLAASAFTVSSASAIAAASSNVGPATAGAGSVTDGSGSAASAVPNVVGAAPHVTLSAVGWQALAVVGALWIIGAGVLVIWRADRM